jgi:hypothetical protein
VSIISILIDKKQAAACPMCHWRPKKGLFDFCSNDCENNAALTAPLLIEVPQGHDTYTMGRSSHSYLMAIAFDAVTSVESEFISKWKHPGPGKGDGKL